MKKETKLVRDAINKLLENPFEGDAEHRTGAQLVALAVLREALNGNVAAMKEIADRIEGKVTDRFDFTEKLDPADVRERIRILVEKLRGESLLRLPTSATKKQ